VSIKLISAVFDSDIGPSPKRLVLLALADGAGDEGCCWPKMRKIAGKAGLSIGRTRFWVAQLEEDGLVRRELRPLDDKSNLSSKYWLSPTAIGARRRSEPEDPPLDPTGPPPAVPTGPPSGSDRVSEPSIEPKSKDGRNSAPSPTDGLFEPPPKAKKRGSRLPAGFDVNDDMKAWKRENAPHVHLRNELAQFKDHWAAAAGASAVKLDWVAAWRTWMRRAEADWLRREGQQQRPRPTGTRTRTDPITGHMREEY